MLPRALLSKCAVALFIAKLSFAQTPVSVFKYTFESDDATSATSPPNPPDGPIEEDFINLPNNETNPNPNGSLPATIITVFRGGNTPEAQNLPARAAVGGTLFNPNSPSNPSAQYLSLIFNSFDPAANGGNGGAGTTTYLGMNAIGGIINDGANTSRTAPLVPLAKTGPAPSLQDLVANPQNYALRFKVRSAGYDGGSAFQVRLFLGYYLSDPDDAGPLTGRERGFYSLFTVPANTADFQQLVRRLSNFTKADLEPLPEGYPQNVRPLSLDDLDFKLQLIDGDNAWGSTAVTGVNNRIDIDDYEILYSPLPSIPTPTPTVSLGGNQLTYTQNFDGPDASIVDPIDGSKTYFTPNGWTIPNGYWRNEEIIREGVDQFVGTGGNPFGVYDPITMITSGRYWGIEPVPAPTYPRAPVRPVRSFSEFGGSGGWLANSARALNRNAGANLSQKQTERKATLKLTNLPPHSFIDIEALLGFGGSLDGNNKEDNNEHPDYHFRVLVDGVQVTTALGTNIATGDGYNDALLTSHQGSNLTPLYGEEWNGNSTSPVGWTTSSAYDLSRINSLKNIPHTANNVTIDFLHGSDDDSFDELIALDNISVRLKSTQSTRSIPSWTSVVPSGGLVYEQNFNATVNVGGSTSEWQIPAGWLQQGVINNDFIVGCQAATSNNLAPVSSPNGVGLISILRNQDVGPVAAEPVGVQYPVKPMIPPTNPNSLGFTGKWLNTTSTSGNGLAVLEFKDLPPHTSIDLDFKLIFGGSIDSSAEDGVRATNFSEPMKTLDENASPFQNSIFAVRVLDKIDDTDRSVDFGVSNGTFKTNSRFIPSYRSVINGEINGASLTDISGIYPLAVGANMFSSYSEYWTVGPNNQDPAPNVNSRLVVGWTPSNAYDIKHVSSLTNVPHTASTIRIEFLHGLNSNFNDEQIAIDDIKLKLNTGPVDSDPTQLTVTEWKSQMFSSAQVANQAVSGNNADPDCDGLPNLLEYAAGSDPLQGEKFPIWSTNFSFANPEIRVYKNTEANGVTLRVQKSTSLASGQWTDLGDPSSEAQVGGNNSISNSILMIFTDSEFTEGSTAFYRVVAIPN